MSGTDTYKYRAFISYSHLDDKPAGTLFNRLEAYRLPPKARRETGHNGRLGTFFRDRDELRASGDLSEQIKSALAASEFLIVLCSPEAATSPWVNREILEFKRLHGEKNILAVILSGEPHGSGAGPDAECFPEALRFRLGENGALSDTAAEPLAADFRKNGDGKRLGFLKLAAALADVDLARLLERDQQRRQRRVTAVTLASSILMLAMSGLALFAFNAQQEAERQQAEVTIQRNKAEELVGYMVGPLTDNLEEVGRLDFLSSIADQVLVHYTADEESSMSCQALVHKARAFHTMNRVANDNGQPENSLHPAQAALSLFRPNADRCETDVTFNRQLAFAEAWAAEPYWVSANNLNKDDSSGAERRRLLNTALSNYQRMRTASQKLDQLEGCDLEYAYDLSEAEMQIGKTYLRLAEPDLAEQHLDLSRQYILRLMKAEGEVIRSCTSLEITDEQKSKRLADIMSWQGELYETRQQHAKSIESYRSARENYKFAMGEPENRNWPEYRNYLGMYLGEARNFYLSDNLSEAARSLEPAIQGCSTLLSHDPGNQEWKNFCSLIKFARETIQKGENNDPDTL